MVALGGIQEERVSLYWERQATLKREIAAAKAERAATEPAVTPLASQASRPPQALQAKNPATDSNANVLAAKVTTEAQATTQVQAEAQTPVPAEIQTEPQSETQTQLVSQTPAPAEIQTEPQSETQTQLASQTPTPAEIQTEPQSETQTQLVSQPPAPAEIQAQPQSETQTQLVSQTQAQPPVPVQTLPRSPPARAVQESGIIPLTVSVRFEPGTESSDFSQSIEVAISAWLTSWQQQDLLSYLASYHAMFEPSAFADRAAWQENRRRNIEGKSSIRLEASDLQLNNSSNNTAQVQFWLTYQSPGYSDITQKKLNIMQEDESWFILNEENLEVRSLSYRN